MALDLSIRQPLDTEPQLGAELKRLRMNVRLNRFINTFLETGNAQSTADRLGVSLAYVMNMLKSPIVRVIIQEELNIALTAARVNRARLILRLYEFLESPLTDGETACKLVETLSTLMDVPAAPIKKLESAVATTISYEIIDSQTGIAS